MSIDKSESPAPALYIVATPIGNLDDITLRAIEVLKSSDIIAAEDTRHSQKLLNHLGIQARLFAYHEHNEQEAAARLVELIEQGHSVALVSDAGTPLISDPGYRLVERAGRRGLRVVPVPGASAALAALCVSGLPTDRFLFEGFLPAKQQARRKRLAALQHEPCSVVLYESCHRIVACLRDLVEVLGAQRRMVFARELTKTFETVRRLDIAACLEWVEQDPDQQRGEIVMVIAGAAGMDPDEQALADTMTTLLAELPLKQAASLASKLSGRSRNECYQLGLSLKAQGDD